MHTEFLKIGTIFKTLTYNNNNVLGQEQYMSLI